MVHSSGEFVSIWRISTSGMLNDRMTINFVFSGVGIIMRIRANFHSIVPRHFRSPLSLATRLIKTRDRAAYSAIAFAALSAVLTPLDILLRNREERIYKAAHRRRHPLVFVVGAPRSGTTICQQLLLRYLPLAYLNNVTSLFPRSPLIGCRILGGPRLNPSNTSSFYGKTSGLRGPNDALYIWDRWFGTDRSRIPERPDEDTAEAMRRFFAACESEFRLPMLNKFNSLIAAAHFVADIMSPCFFICMQRSDTYLAQSLYKARFEIGGAWDRPYGLCCDEFVDPNPVSSVCRQVLFYKKLAKRQQERIGETRFWIVNYEDLCENPADLIQRVSSQILEKDRFDATSIRSISHHNSVRVAEHTFEEIKNRLHELESNSSN